MSVEALREVLESADRSRAPATAPPSGLCLETVWYPGDDGAPDRPPA
jgi:tRNA U38,U39,U40 pseudouridine synthase TruA